MSVVGVELGDLGMKFEYCDSLCDPVLGLLISLGIDVELVQGSLGTTLVLDVQRTRLEVLGEGQLLVAVSLA